MGSVVICEDIKCQYIVSADDVWTLEEKVHLQPPRIPIDIESRPQSRGCHEILGPHGNWDESIHGTIWTEYPWDHPCCENLEVQTAGKAK